MLLLSILAPTLAPDRKKKTIGAISATSLSSEASSTVTILHLLFAIDGQITMRTKASQKSAWETGHQPWPFMPSLKLPFLTLHPQYKGSCHVIHGDKNSSDSLLSTVAPHTGPSTRFGDKSSLSNWRELSSIFLFSYDTALSLLVLGFQTILEP